MYRHGWIVIGLFCGLLFLGCSPKPTKKESSGQSETTPADLKKGEVEKSSQGKSKLAAIDESLDIERLMAARLSQEELDEGWIRLFDGHTKMGWDFQSTEANWHIDGETIVATEGKTGLLCTTTRFADYELKLDFKSSSETNSGVFLRTPSKPTNPTEDCFELNIAPTDNPFPTGSLVGRSKVEPDSIGPIDSEEWQSFHALLDGDHIQIWFNGKPVVDYIDTTKRHSGLIGLQFREGPVQFRNIRLRPILLNSILPAKELSQWKFDEKGPAKFNLEKDGTLNIEGGKGQIELQQPLQDFCMQAEVMTLSPKTNTGIFFRCIMGEEMNGYECQINNSFIEDRRRPTDAGTGAIFRRQAARAVLADDNRWGHITLVADGPHIATWVEGVQVVDWNDTREAHENPRAGLRLEGGSIILQAHDPDCKAKFRKLETMTLPDRNP